ncbi:MAG: Gfo/Idh/MocA family oxidoreductase [Elusimicrobiota bacterium]|nr:MAG: Gfo/Idh/MocA family oxidoreductase [Elusimicrobiota bacterium]
MKVGVVGMGKMGLTHAAVLETLEPGCVAGVVEADRGAHGTVKSLLKAPVHADLAGLLAATALDAAIVSTPTFTHEKIVAELIERGVAVLVEKPLAENLAVCERLAALAERKKAITAVGYSIDYDPLFNEARRLLPKLGRITRYRAFVEHAEVFGPKKGWLFQKAKSGGGVIINPAPHMLFVLLEAFGTPKSVKAVLRSPYSAVEDEAEVDLDHGDFTGRLTASWSVPGKPNLELALYVEGENGRMAVGADELLIEEVGATRSVARKDLAADGAFDLAPAARASNYWREDREFLDCVRRKAVPRNSIQSTLKVDRLIDAIYRAGASGQEVPWA